MKERAKLSRAVSVIALCAMLLLLLEKLVLKERLTEAPAALQHVYAAFLILVSWTIFRFEEFSRLGQVFSVMFRPVATDWAALLLPDTSVCFKLLFILPALFFCFPLPEKLRLREDGVGSALLVNFLYAALLALSVMFIISSSYNPFIYFRF